MKKILAAILVPIFIFAAVNTGYADSSDISGHWAEAALERLTGLGVINGYGDKFSPDKYITRGETAVILERIMRYTDRAENVFSDLGDSFCTDAVLALNKNNVMRGDGDKIRPDDVITRQEAAVMLARAFSVEKTRKIEYSFDDLGTVADWAYEYVAGMVNKGYMRGSGGKLNVNDNITRAEAAQLINNMIGNIYSEPKVYTEGGKGISIVSSPGAVIEGAQIDGDLIVTDAVKNGTVTLKNTSVSGRIIVADGESRVVLTGGSEAGGISAPDGTEPVKYEIYTEEIPDMNRPPEDEYTEEESVVLPGMLPSYTLPSGSGKPENGEQSGTETASPETVKKAVVCIEAFTAGLGYIAEPVEITVDGDTTVATVTETLIEKKGFESVCSGSVDSSYYLSSITGIPEKVPSVCEAVRTRLEKSGIDFDISNYNTGSLGEFDLTWYSGWMYSVNGRFTDIGMSEYYVEDGDVVRIQFSLAMGADIGNAYSDGGSKAENWFGAVNREELTRLMALSGKDKTAEYLDIITKPDITQKEIDEIVLKLKK